MNPPSSIIRVLVMRDALILVLLCFTVSIVKFKIYDFKITSPPLLIQSSFICHFFQPFIHPFSTLHSSILNPSSIHLQPFIHPSSTLHPSIFNPSSIHLQPFIHPSSTLHSSISNFPFIRLRHSSL